MAFCLGVSHWVGRCERFRLEWLDIFYDKLVYIGYSVLLLNELMYLHTTDFNLSLFAGFATSRKGGGGGQGVCLQWGGAVDTPLVLTSSGGHCSGRYASYWNEFLFARFICCLFTGFISCFQPFSDWVYLESEFPVAEAKKGRPNVNTEQHICMQTCLHMQLYAGVQPEWCRYLGRKFAGKLCIFLVIYARKFLKLCYILDGVWYPIFSILSNYYFGANLNWKR